MLKKNPKSQVYCSIVRLQFEIVLVIWILVILDCFEFRALIFELLLD